MRDNKQDNEKALKDQWSIVRGVPQDDAFSGSFLNVLLEIIIKFLTSNRLYNKYDQILHMQMTLISLEEHQ